MVFVSSDQDQSGFDEYYSQMPWLALPYSDRDRKAGLSAEHGVRGIPTLVLMNRDGSILSTNGRALVLEDRTGGWIKQQATSAPGPTPVANWNQHQDPKSGKPYWYNPQTGESTWENPVTPSAPPPPPPPPPQASDWKQYQDPASGRPYWHNPNTGVPTWNNPIAAALDQDVAKVSMQRQQVNLHPKSTCIIVVLFASSGSRVRLC